MVIRSKDIYLEIFKKRNIEVYWERMYPKEGKLDEVIWSCVLRDGNYPELTSLSEENY